MLSLDVENAANFKKSKFVGRKPVFEVVHLLNNALKYIYILYKSENISRNDARNLKIK